MEDLLGAIYPWMKALHIMAVLSWMAGLFYLPRLFVYHAERGLAEGEPRLSLVIMEEKLLRVIMTPAMVVTWIAGLCLVLTPGIVEWSLGWPWVKGAAVIAMTWFHHWLGQQRRALHDGRSLSGRRYRMMNEVPTLLMVLIVVSVVVKF